MSFYFIENKSYRNEMDLKSSLLQTCSALLMRRKDIDDVLQWLYKENPWCTQFHRPTFICSTAKSYKSSTKNLWIVLLLVYFFYIFNLFLFLNFCWKQTPLSYNTFWPQFLHPPILPALLPSLSLRSTIFPTLLPPALDLQGEESVLVYLDHHEGTGFNIQ